LVVLRLRLRVAAGGGDGAGRVDAGRRRVTALVRPRQQQLDAGARVGRLGRELLVEAARDAQRAQRRDALAPQRGLVEASRKRRRLRLLRRSGREV